MKRFVKRAAWVLVALAILGVVSWTAANALGSNRLTAAIQELEKAGYRTTAASLAPPPVPRAENAAPLYVAAFALMDGGSDTEREWTEQALQGETARLPDDRRAALEAWIARNAEALDLLERACARPRCLFERNYADGFRMLMPELTPAMGMSRLLQLRAEFRARAGDLAGARSDVERILRLSNAFREDPVLVAQLVRLALTQRALEAVDRLVTADTRQEDLRKWAETIRDAGVPPGLLVPAFRGELAMVADFLRNPPYEYWMWIGTAPGRGESAALALLRPWVKLDGAGCLGDYRRLAEAAALPYLQAQEQADALQERLTASGSWKHPFRRLFFPSAARVFRRCTEVEAKAAVIRAGLDAERVRQSTGSYPETLGALDPATGKPLLYDRPAGRIASAAGTKEEPVEWRLRRGP